MLVISLVTVSLMYLIKDDVIRYIYNQYVLDNISDERVSRGHIFQRRPIAVSNPPLQPQACQVPQIDPWDPTIMKHIVVHEELKCKGRPPLTFVDNNFLRINKGVIAQYPEEIGKCVYYPCDSGNYKDYEVTFHKAVPVSEDFIRVECFGKKTGRKMYANFHGFFPNKLRTEKRVWEVCFIVIFIGM